MAVTCWCGRQTPEGSQGFPERKPPVGWFIRAIPSFPEHQRGKEGSKSGSRGSQLPSWVAFPQAKSPKSQDQEDSLVQRSLLVFGLPNTSHGPNAAKPPQRARLPRLIPSEDLHSAWVCCFVLANYPLQAWLKGNPERKPISHQPV